MIKTLKELWTQGDFPVVWKTFKMKDPLLARVDDLLFHVVEAMDDGRIAHDDITPEDLGLALEAHDLTTVEQYGNGR